MPPRLDDARQLAWPRPTRRLTHWVEAAAVYEAEFDRFDLAASLVGGVAEVKDASFAGDRLWTWYAGANLSSTRSSSAPASGWKTPAGSGGVTSMPASGAGSGRSTPRSPTAACWAPAAMTGSASPGTSCSRPIWSWRPGLLLAGDVAYFDNDLDRAAKDETGGDRGWVWVAKLEVAF